MTYRPYPNADRARRQVERHDYETPPLTAVRPATPLQERLAEAFAPLAALRLRVAAPPVDEYRLSTR
jgi:hypothetical protein